MPNPNLIKYSFLISDLLNKPAAPADPDAAKRNELFKELNQGEAITSKLKKVTSDMQTHKNPELRAGVGGLFGILKLFSVVCY